jgi:moderate conductance mechanosensitive channel
MSYQSILQLILDWLLKTGPFLVFILLGAFVIRFILFRVVDRTIKKVIGPPSQEISPDAEEKREKTLIRIINGTLDVLIWLITIMMILSEIGIEIGPMLATAGIAGIAIGFGGQYLIKDLISGFFIIIENQYRVDDIVSFGDIRGQVEDITLRVTTLRDVEGNVHHVPHGTISEVTNLSKGFSKINLIIGVAYESDIEHVEKIVNKIGNELSEDPKWKEKILETPEFLRVDNFGDSAIDIKIVGKTLPAAQWEVTGELRKRIKITFDKKGIVIPYPQVTVSYLKDGDSKS